MSDSVLVATGRYIFVTLRIWLPLWEQNPKETEFIRIAANNLNFTATLLPERIPTHRIGISNGGALLEHSLTCQTLNGWWLPRRRLGAPICFVFICRFCSCSKETPDIALLHEIAFTHQREHHQTISRAAHPPELRTKPTVGVERSNLNIDVTSRSSFTASRSLKLLAPPIVRGRCYKYRYQINNNLGKFDACPDVI